MKLKIASYNISGGFYQDNKFVDFFDKDKFDNIDTRLLKDIIKIINKEDIDIICFQEIITTERINYINKIINGTHLKYVDYFELSTCHIIKDTECGLAILSRYPINGSIKKLFTNPMLSKTTNNGNTYYTFDKGYMISNINVNNKILSILTHHGFPYRRFNSTPEDNKNIFEEFDNQIKNLKPQVITGDFNSEKFLNMMPYTNKKYTKTIDDITTIDGMKFDNILVNNNVKFLSKLVKSLSDHFMVITEIDLKQEN